MDNKPEKEKLKIFNKKNIKLLISFLVGLGLISLIISPFVGKKIYFLLSKTSLYNTVSLKFTEEEHHEHTHEEEFVFFEDEFKSQPYANPLPSSVEIIQLSLSFFILAFLINQLKKK